MQRSSLPEKLTFNDFYSLSSVADGKACALTLWKKLLGTICFMVNIYILFSSANNSCWCFKLDSADMSLVFLACVMCHPPDTNISFKIYSEKKKKKQTQEQWSFAEKKLLRQKKAWGIKIY